MPVGYISINHSISFKMDLGNILLWSIITLLCVVPFIVLSNIAKKKKQQDLKALLDFAANHHFTITQYDLWFKSAIGLDEAKQAIVFVSNLRGTPVEQWVMLEDIQKCQINETSRMVGGQDQSSKVVDKFELVFSSSKGNTAFEFFNVNSGNLTPTIEYQLAEKWSKMANERIAALVQAK